MAFKFSLQTEPSVESDDTFLDDMMELSEIKCEIEALVGQLPELDAVYDNLTSSIEALNNAKNKGAVQVLNADGSLEALLGIAEDAITVKAATEGLGLTLRHWWGKFVDWVKKICRNIANFFRKLFGITPKYSKEASIVARAIGQDPKQVQEDLDVSRSLTRDLSYRLGVAFDEKKFNEGFVHGCIMMKEVQKSLEQFNKGFSTRNFKGIMINDMRKVEEDLDKLIASSNETLSQMSSSSEKGATEGLIQVAVTADAVKRNLETISKDATTNIPKWSREVADNSEKIEKVISSSELAKMSAQEIEELYASGVTVEDPALVKVAITLYKAIASGAAKLNALIGRLLSKRISVSQAYVAAASKAAGKVIRQAINDDKIKKIDAGLGIGDRLSED